MTTIDITSIGNLESYIIRLLVDLRGHGAITTEQESAAIEKMDELLAILLGTASGRAALASAAADTNEEA